VISILNHKISILKYPTEKKHKYNDDYRIFNEKWSISYFFIEINRKAVCLVCRETVSVFKEFNIKRHYETKHEAKFGNLKGKLLFSI